MLSSLRSINYVRQLSCLYSPHSKSNCWSVVMASSLSSSSPSQTKLILDESAKASSCAYRVKDAHSSDFSKGIKRQFCLSSLQRSSNDAKKGSGSFNCDSDSTTSSVSTNVHLKESEKLDEDYTLLKNDPEVTSLLKDINNDFDGQLQEKSLPTEGNEMVHTVGIKQDNCNLNQNSNSNRHFLDEVDRNFEYDYRVAEDIEEYDYKDSSKLADEQVRPQKILPISLERGKNGVFDFEELIVLLENLGAQNIVSFPIPPEANFCDHMVVVSAKSQRHLQAINEELLWIHKRKKSTDDLHLRIEGRDKSNWCAMDMGNIVLHIFYGPSREYYDIESLWTLGPSRDPKCQEENQDPYALSPEDLFWLATTNATEKAKVAENIIKSKNTPDGYDQSKA